MKTRISLIVLLISIQFVSGQTAKVVNKPEVKLDGIYECKEYEHAAGNSESPAPAYYRFFPDGVLLFCHYEKLTQVNKDSMATAEEVFHSVLTQAMLDKMKENVAEDATNVYNVLGKFKITAYRYQVLPNGICYDILSEKPNCLGKPNLKVPESTVLKSDDGDAADDRYFKFVQVNDFSAR